MHQGASMHMHGPQCESSAHHGARGQLPSDTQVSEGIWLRSPKCKKEKMKIACLSDCSEHHFVAEADSLSRPKEGPAEGKVASSSEFSSSEKQKYTRRHSIIAIVYSLKDQSCGR